MDYVRVMDYATGIVHNGGDACSIVLSMLSIMY